MAGMGIGTHATANREKFDHDDCEGSDDFASYYEELFAEENKQVAENRKLLAKERERMEKLMEEYAWHQALIDRAIALANEEHEILLLLLNSKKTQVMGGTQTGESEKETCAASLEL